MQYTKTIMRTFTVSFLGRKLFFWFHQLTSHLFLMVSASVNAAFQVLSVQRSDATHVRFYYLLCLHYWCKVLWWVCLCAHITWKPHGQISPNFFLHVAVFVFLWWRCDMLCEMLFTSGFVDDMFSYHGASGPESSSELLQYLCVFHAIFCFIFVLWVFVQKIWDVCCFIWWSQSLHLWHSSQNLDYNLWLCFSDF